MNKRKRDKLFAKYIEPFADDIFRIINNVFDDNELSNDLSQIVLEKAWVNLHTLRSEKKAKEWIKGIIRNEIRMELRSKKSKYELISLEDQLVAMMLKKEYEFIEEDLLTTLEKKENRQQMIAAIRRLSKTEQLIIRLHLMEELPFREIGDMIDVKADTVKHRYYRAVVKANAIYCEMEEGGKSDAK